VRDATESDLDALCEMIREFAAYEKLEDTLAFEREDLRRHLFGPEPPARVLVAEDDGEVVGFALWFPTFSSFLGRPGIWLEDLFVREAHRGRGHGLALFEELRDRTEGRLECAVLDWNEPTIRFYRDLGGEPVDGWTRYRWLPGRST
jgi:GNAT superfamily N-acetyltransferase